MPEISLRAEQMPASPIRKLVPLADAARARGTKIYHLNIGQPDLPSPQTGLDALKKIDRTVLEYSPSDGYRSLREKLVGYYEQFQIKLSPDDIIVTTGGSEAVLFAFMSCLNPGDEIIVPEPAYANYMAFAISAGAVIRPVVASIENGFALPPIEEFEKLINDRTRGILICNPNNPTGYLYTRREMNRIRDMVKKYDLFLFSDEVYREFIYTGSPYISACHLEGIEQNVVLIDSVSKRYSECGIRIGALVWNHPNAFATPAAVDAETHMTPEGIRIARVMQRQGISVDVSHLNEACFWDLFAKGERPPMASHSCCRALCDHVRNLTDDQIRAMIQYGGYIGVNFYPRFLSADCKADSVTIAQHIDHICQLGGSDIVGFGSDFDGIEVSPDDVRNPAELPNLLTALRNYGYNDESIERICGGNLKAYFARLK